MQDGQDGKTTQLKKLKRTRGTQSMSSNGVKASLPPLPPLRPQTDGDGPDLTAVIEMINESLVPILSTDPNDRTQARFKCAGCGRLEPWTTHHWGSWDTGEKAPILVRRRDGKGFARICVPIRKAGRTCTDCTAELSDWRRSKEADVTVLRDLETGKADGSRAPKRGKRDRNHTTIWRTWYAVSQGMQLKAEG
jgi:hypothetical protein